MFAGLLVSVFFEEAQSIYENGGIALNNKVYRCYVEKRPGFDIHAKAMQSELSAALKLPEIALRMFNRYDIQNISENSLHDVKNTVLSEPMSDNCFDEHLPALSPGTRLLYVESLPGQFDIRADSCEQCIQLLLGGNRPVVRTALVYAIEGVCSDEDFSGIKTYLINPVECREASPSKPRDLDAQDRRVPGSIPEVQGYTKMNPCALETAKSTLGLAMSISDMQFIREYYRRERRDPTLTELRVIDTYWSDHCRHTTFNSLIESADISDKRVRKAYDLFLSVNGSKPATLMNIATAAMRHLRDKGELPMLDESDEINACTVRVKVQFDNTFHEHSVDSANNNTKTAQTIGKGHTCGTGEDCSHASPSETEDWLLFFKNETHNHPTEIEPFGGAATCIGGAIRDPLSGRAFVYQSMRITGSGNPGKPIEDTLPGKLPQRKISSAAASGFSSYGNQIGLATGYVKEIYHEGYVAKRLEAGAVVGAAPQSSVRREKPQAGDVVVLLGGRTGRDGIGGATGSSTTHDTETVSERASEVQKGNAPEERKLQRLFRNPEATRLIKKCNDFGAGGASVAIGELADGVEITLDAMPVKYEGMDGTELAISESQERMAVVVAKSDLPYLKQLAESENIEATTVARVTEEKRLVMLWRGQKIVDIDRSFLDTNGPTRHTTVTVPNYTLQNPQYINHNTKSPNTHPPTHNPQHTSISQPPTHNPQLSTLNSPHPTLNSPLSTLNSQLLTLAGDINYCSQKGLVERFDHSIGAASVFEPYGGKFALSETQVMAALLPSPGARTASVMAYGYDPYFTEADPFAGSEYAVVSSVAKLVASGVSPGTVHLSLQEYFPSPGDDSERWGRPFAAMLGAFNAQMGLRIAAIGGKDSMSGSFGELDVPPTLISFAVGVADAEELISPEFKGPGNPVYLLETPTDSDGSPDYTALRAQWDNYIDLCRNGKVLSARSCEADGTIGAIMKMAFGNMTGFKSALTDTPVSCNAIMNDNNYHSHSSRFPKHADENPSADSLFSIFTSKPEIRGSIIFEASMELSGFTLLGHTQPLPSLTFGSEDISLRELCMAWQQPLESVFPTRVEQPGIAPVIKSGKRPLPRSGPSFAKPRTVIPVFPGTNCEYDTALAIEKAGGIAEAMLIRNLSPGMLEESVANLKKAIDSAQIIVFPGGFSGGDEPDGSGKFIVSLFRNKQLTDAVHSLLFERDGLILGICNGFQALIKLGFLPYGRISPMTENCPTLTFNRIGRHQARYIGACVSSVNSPWLSKCSTGEVYIQPVSHGEGRLTATEDMLMQLEASGQIAFQYVDHDYIPSMDITHNPNGSDWAIEGLCSADGRILGKMAHCERYGKYVAKNVPGNKHLPLFEGGIEYFR